MGGEKESEGSQFARTNWAKCFLIDPILLGRALARAKPLLPLPPPRDRFDSCRGSTRVTAA